MHKKTFLLIAITVIIMALTVFKIYQYRVRKEASKFRNFNDLESDERFTVIKLTDKILKIRILPRIQMELMVKNGDTVMGERSECVFYEQTTHSIWVSTMDYMSDDDGHFEERMEWINFDLDGVVLTKKNRIDSIDVPWRYMQNQYAGKGIDSTVGANGLHLQKFIKERFNWGSLNPFKGMGAPANAVRTVNWSGTALMDLVMGGEKLSFRLESEIMDQELRLGIWLIRFPSGDVDLNNRVLVAIKNRVDMDNVNGLYLVKLN